MEIFPSVGLEMFTQNFKIHVIPPTVRIFIQALVNFSSERLNIGLTQRKAKLETFLVVFSIQVNWIEIFVK